MYYRDDEEMKRNPEKDTFGYYKAQIFNDLFNLKGNFGKNVSEIISQCKNNLNQITQQDPDTKFYFLVLALGALKLKSSLEKTLSNPINLISTLFKSDAKDENMELVERVVKHTKAAIFKFIHNTDDRYVLEEFREGLTQDEKKSFQEFWGYDFAWTKPKQKSIDIAEKPTPSTSSTQNNISNIQNVTQVETPNTTALNDAAKNVLEALRKLQVASATAKLPELK